MKWIVYIIFVTHEMSGRKKNGLQTNSPKKKTAYEFTKSMQTRKKTVYFNKWQQLCARQSSNWINAKWFCTTTTTTIYVHGIYLYGAQQRKMAFNEGNNRLTRSGMKIKKKKKKLSATTTKTYHPTNQAQEMRITLVALAML